MNIEDEARQEAERRWPHTGDTTVDIRRSALRHTFVKGVKWASEQGEWEYALQADGDDEPWSDWYESRELLADNLDALAARDDERLVRRRKAGPWEPAEEDGDA